MTVNPTPRATTRQSPEAQEPRLRGLPTRTPRMASLPFGLFMVALFAGGAVGLLFFITTLQNQSFEVRQAQREATELGYRVSDLEAQLYAAQAPRELARRATELGMVPNPYGVFIDLETGTVVGEATPVSGGEIPSLRVLPPPPPEPEVPLEAAPVEVQAVEGVPAPAVSPDADAATQDAAADVAGDGASPDAAAGGVGDTGGDQTTTGEAQP